MNELVEATPRQLALEAEVKKQARYQLKIYRPNEFTKPRSNNTSGFRGVTWNKQAGKFIAKTKQGKVNVYLGCYDTAEDANKAVKAKKNLNRIYKTK